MAFKDFFLPTPGNNYRANLLSNTALSLYVVALLLANIVFGNLSVVGSAASLDVLEIVSLHNRERERAGLPKLTFNSILADSAREKGVAMLESDCWSHYCPPGTSPWVFFNDVGYDYSFAGENLAEGFNQSEAVMRAWMNSKTHRENILKQEFTEVGIAMVTGGYQGRSENTIIVVHFGSPQPGANTPTGNQVTGDSRETGDEIESAGAGEAALDLSTPREAEVIGSSEVEISGSYNGTDHDTTELEYVIRQEQETRTSGRIIANGGIFAERSESLPDGASSLELRSTTSEASTEVNFTIDSTPPQLENSQLVSTARLITPEGEDIYRLNFSAPERLKSAELTILGGESGVDNARYEMHSEDGINFWLELDTAYQTKASVLGATDLAGNRSELHLELPPAAEINTIQTAGIVPAIGINPLHLAGIILVAGLLGLYALDFIYLKKLKAKLQLPDVKRAQMHIPTLAVLLLMLLIGNFSGTI